MPDILEDAKVEGGGGGDQLLRLSANSQPVRIGVAVGRGQSGFQALKWALDKAIPPDGSHLLYLLHVYPPIRWIPNAMGGKFPIEQVSEEMVKRFKQDRFLEQDEMLNRYRRLCEKKKVKYKVCYTEGDSVHKELVAQILNLGITKLILGTSSQSLLSRALKKESIPTSVAKHAPDYCTVMVVCRGKLCSVKDATMSPDLGGSSPTSPSTVATDARTSAVSETSVLSGHTCEDDLSTSDIIEEDGGSMWPGVIWSDAYQTILHKGRPQSASLDLSELSRIKTASAGALNLPQTMARNYSTPSAGHAIESLLASALFDQGPNSMNHGIPHFIDCLESRASLASDWNIAEGRFYNRVSQVHESTNPTLQSDNSSVSNISGASRGSELMVFSEYDALPQSSMDGGMYNTSQEFSSQRHELHTSLSENSVNTLGGMIIADSEGDLLQSQLQETKQAVQKEVDRQVNTVKKAEKVVASARKMIMEHERHRNEALEDADMWKQQALRDAKSCEEAVAALQLVVRDRDRLQQMLAEEMKKHEDTQVELEAQVKRGDACAAAAEEEQRRFEEMAVRLEEVAKMLEVESRLRKEAQERASHETVAKNEALAALRKEQRQKYTQYTFHELQLATDHFHEENKLGEGGYGPVYRGKLHHTTVAIKVLARDGLHGREEFQSEVELLSRIHHPHMVILLGACPEKGCIVYEYMANGSLEDRLSCKDGTAPLPWFVRFRICLEVATALLFLHSRPQPIVHRDLKPGNILLDRYFVSKIGDVGLAKLVPGNLTFSVTMYNESMPVGTFAYIDPDYQRTGVVSCESDVYALGIVMLQLLTGMPAVGVVNVVEEAVDNGQLEEVLDKSAGEWPLTEAMALACLSLQCAEPKRRHRPNLEKRILPELESIQRVACPAAAASCMTSTKPVVPSFFFCPISQEIMDNPHVAADGFTYEHDAIKAWLGEHTTSPMTNLVLSHTSLTPNHTLRSAIREWRENGLISD